MSAEDIAIAAPGGAMVPAKPVQWFRWVRSIYRHLRRARHHRDRMLAPGRVRQRQLQQPQNLQLSRDPAWACRKAQVNADLQSGMLR
jgi:hypothetical protein